MPTVTSFTIDFDSPEIREFTRSTETTLKDPSYGKQRDYLIHEGYAETALTRQGPPFNPADHVPLDQTTGTNGVLGVMQAEIRTYDLVEIATLAIHSQVETQIIHSQAVEVVVWHELFLAPGLSAQEAQNIRDAFSAYVDGPGTNPDDFATDNGIPAGNYEAMVYFELRKSGQPHVDDRQDRSIVGYYVQDEVFQLKYRNSRYEDVRERDDGAVEVDDPEDTVGAIDIIRDIVEDSPAMNCEHIDYKQERIATLIQYPEFKIVWRRVVIKVGCVRISLKLPQLYYRNTKRVLYAVLAHRADVDQIVIDVIVYCLKRSALAATIAGLVTANVGVAAAAFKALFLECIKQQLHTYMKCLLPDLTLLKKKSDWHPV
ncbi:hypothetical protein ACQUQP_07085 [Marinobacterium sp. YM272]|uniref:hypothetical protein n=1 Tax=Marinobacterium sp. YM272 TaxID=3421654 RepID=UPI003D7F94E9